jgi:hypothetical protein
MLLLYGSIIAFAGNNLDKSAPHLRANHKAPAAHPADHPPAHAHP